MTELFLYSQNGLGKRRGQPTRVSYFTLDLGGSREGPVLTSRENFARIQIERANVCLLRIIKTRKTLNRGYIPIYRTVQ